MTANISKSGIIIIFNPFSKESTDSLSDSQRSISLIASKNIKSTETVSDVIVKLNVIL